MIRPDWLTGEDLRVWNKFWDGVKANNYNSLDAKESEAIRTIYYRQLCEHSENWHKTGKLITPIRFTDGAIFLNNYGRMVIGNHGPYIEFATTDVDMSVQLEVRFEAWRKTFDKAKYIWLTPVAFITYADVKVYHQRWPVRYADYVKDRLYVSPYQLGI